MLTEASDFVSAIQALDAAFIRHANAGAVDQLVAACYADDALVLPPNAPFVRGRGQVGELLRELIEDGLGDVSRETTPLHVVGDLGVGVGSYALATRTAKRRPGARP